MLLQKDLEQTIVLDQLYHRSRNIRIGLDIADTVNRQPDRQSVLNSLASQLLTEMELDIALVAEPSSGGPRLLGQFGPLPSGANPQALLGQRNPLRYSLQRAEKDALRITPGTVPGTVLGVVRAAIRSGSRIAISRWTDDSKTKGAGAGIVGSDLEVTCGLTCMAVWALT